MAKLVQKYHHLCYVDLKTKLMNTFTHNECMLTKVMWFHCQAAIFYSCIIEVFSAEEGIQMVYLKTSILRVKYKKHASNTASLNVNLYIMLNRFWENLVKNLFLIKKKDKPNLEENNCSKLISSSFNWFYVVQEIYQLNSIWFYSIVLFVKISLPQKNTI